MIEGLYVTGNDSGGYYSMTYPNLSTGNACGRTVTFGRMIAKRTVAKSAATPKSPPLLKGPIDAHDGVDRAFAFAWTGTAEETRGSAQPYFTPYCS